MAGLMKPTDERPMPQPERMSAAERNPLNDPEAEEGTNVSPEDQAQYDQLVTNGMSLIYNEKAMPQLLETIAGAGNPVQGLANAVVTVVTRLEDSAGKAGQEFSGDVKLHAATELMEQMVELAETAGIHEYTPEEMESAYYLALDTYRVAKQEQGTLPVDELKQDMGELMQADQEGRLGEMIPGIEEFAQRAPKQEQQGGNGLMRRG